MRDLKNKLTLSKNSRNIQSKRTKGFGYQILGFGGGVAGAGPVSVDYLVVAGGGGGGKRCAGGGGGAGGYRTSFPGETKIYLEPGSNAVVIGAGGSSGGGTDFGFLGA